MKTLKVLFKNLNSPFAILLTGGYVTRGLRGVVSKPPPIFNFSFKKKYKWNKFWGGNFFLGPIYLGRMVVPSTKIVINIPSTNENLTLSVQWLAVNTDRAPFYFIIRILCKTVMDILYLKNSCFLTAHFHILINLSNIFAINKYINQCVCENIKQKLVVLDIKQYIQLSQGLGTNTRH